jgi:1-acyl-sn-glycerol-3-phosphate acyltransferase
MLFLAFSVLLFGLPIVLFGRLVRDPWLARAGCLWGRSVLWLLRVICRLDFRVAGLENLETGPGIIYSKHQSAWETIALRAILPPRQTWVLKRELIWVPIFGWALAMFKPITIDRSAGRKAIRKLLDQGLHALAQGRWIIIFPEGTRVAPGERSTYGIGGAVLAEKSGRPLIPVAHNAGVFWGRRSLLKHPGVIDVVIGPPIAAQGRRAGEINQAAATWIEAQVERLPTAPSGWPLPL